MATESPKGVGGQDCVTDAGASQSQVKAGSGVPCASQL